MFKSIIATIILSAVSSITFAAPCNVKDARVCDIEQQLKTVTQGRSFIFMEFSTSSMSVAAEYEWALGPEDVIHLGDTRQFDDNALFFLIAHEIGHSVNKHGRKTVEHFATVEDRNLSDLELLKKYRQKVESEGHMAKDLNHGQEYEADQFAIQVMMMVGKNPIEAMSKVLKNRVSSMDHPSRRERLAKAQEFIAGVKLASVN